MDDQAWREKSREILTDVKEWRRAHPKAAYVETEEEVHKRMMELEAHILQDAAEASQSREWGKHPGSQRHNAAGETEIHVGNLSYFSRLTDASIFTNRAAVGM